MTGFILFIMAIAWVAFLAWMTLLITSRVKPRLARISVAIGLFAVLLPLPLLDEIVGKSQFEQLCRATTIVHVDHKAAAGRTLFFDPKPSVEIGGSSVRIKMLPHHFVDAETGKLLLSYSTLVAEGGGLARVIRVSEGGGPLIFRGSCGPDEDVKSLVKKLKITTLDRPK